VASGRSVILVAVNGQAAGLLVFEDELRPQSQSVVQKLEEIGLDCVIVTGDNRAATERVAQRIGIKELFAEKMPREKVVIVRKLQCPGAQGGIRR